MLTKEETIMMELIKVLGRSSNRISMHEAIVIAEASAKEFILRAENLNKELSEREEV